MRTIIVSILLLASAAPVVAQMQPEVQGERHDDRRDGDRRDGDQRRGDQRGSDQRTGDQRRGDQRDGDRRDRGQLQRPDDRGGYRGDDRGGDRRDFRDDRRAYGDGDQFARFHGDRYDYPRGYGYRYFGIGTFLPRVFFDQRYYIGQPDYYRLPPAYAGTRWIRVGPDALLIRTYDRRVVRVIRGLFD